jgi:hypothetical protein
MKLRRVYRKIISHQYVQRWEGRPLKLQIVMECGHTAWVPEPSSVARAFQLAFREKAVCKECMRERKNETENTA